MLAKVTVVKIASNFSKHE